MTYATSEHRRSNTFSSSPPFPTSGPLQHPTPSSNDRGRQTAESPADEITPIIFHQRNSRRYDGSPQPNPTGTEGTAGVQTKRNNSTTTSLARQLKKSNRPSGSGGTTANISAGEREDRPQTGILAWLGNTLETFGSIELDNKGSVARDHLALERTFLAWLRTSLAFASIGVAITQLFRLNMTLEQREGYRNPPPASTPRLRQLGKPLGATFLAIAVMLLVVGGRRYFESQYWIIRGKFPASRGSVFLVTALAAILIVASLVVVCVVDPDVFEKR